jgi:hypothetical protein
MSLPPHVVKMLIAVVHRGRGSGEMAGESGQVDAILF